MILKILLSSQQTTTWWGDLKQSMIEVAAALIQKLPESPIVTAIGEAGSSPVESWMPYVNWFVPFSIIVRILGVWTAGIAVYYLIQIVLRWVKVIE